MDKAIEAAARAILALRKSYDGEEETGFGIIHSGVNHAGLPPEDSTARAREVSADFAQAAIRAYLSALKEDPEVVERVKAAIVGALERVYHDASPDEITDAARAALSALEVE